MTTEKMALATAMTKAAPLRPDIKLQQALREFQDALDESQKLGDTLPPESEDVMRLTCEIDRLCATRRSRRLGTRLTSFLNSVQGFTAIVDVVVSSTGNSIAGAVWGAVKISMQVAAGFESYFDSLSTLLMNIGLNSPRYEKYAHLYPNSASLRRELCNYYASVINICTRTVMFVRRRSISQALNALRKPFESEFGPFRTELTRLGEAIRDEISLAAKQQQNRDSADAANERKESSLFRRGALNFRHDAGAQLVEASQCRQRQKKSKLLNACSTYNHETTLNQARRHGSTVWIFHTAEYHSWHSNDGSTTLLCSGIIGSGKTVLCASVVENLVTARLRTSSLAYFFCRHDDASSLTAREIVGSLARQFFGRLPIGSFNQLDESMGDVKFNIDQIHRLLLDLLPINRQYLILLDGLDECEHGEAVEVINTLQILLCSKSHTFKVFWTGRPDFVRRICRRFPPAFHLLQNSLNSGPEISDFIGFALFKAFECGDLQLSDPKILVNIHEALQAGAQDMFLWVALQISSICRENSDEDILRSLENLPKDLPATFRRILLQIDKSRSANPALAKKIFEIVVAAQRPLTLEELREAISITAGDTSWQEARLIHNVVKALECCGCLITVDEESSTVYFAHSSVKQYLTAAPLELRLQSYCVDVLRAQDSFGKIVITYLNLNLFDSQLTRVSTISSNLPDASHLLRASLPRNRAASDIARKVLKNRRIHGYDIGRAIEKEPMRELDPLASFLPYAQKYWLHHTRSWGRSSVDNDFINLLRRIIRGETKTVSLPWTPKDFRGLRSAFVDFTIANKHHIMVIEALCRAHPNLPDPEIGSSFWPIAVEHALEAKNKTSLRLALCADFDLKPLSLDLHENILLKAIEWNDTEIVKMLIRSGLIVSACGPYNKESKGRTTGNPQSYTLKYPVRTRLEQALDHSRNPDLMLMTLLGNEMKVNFCQVRKDTLLVAISLDSPAHFVKSILEHGTGPCPRGMTELVEERLRSLENAAIWRRKFTDPRVNGPDAFTSEARRKLRNMKMIMSILDPNNQEYEAGWG